MKFALLIPEGAPDAPLAELDGRTPLQAAQLPNLDALARGGRLGTARTFPDDLPAHSEIALLSTLGYDPRQHRAGRAALEARSAGIAFGPRDLVLLCDFINSADGRLIDVLAADVTNDEAQAFVGVLNAHSPDAKLRFYTGRGHRNFCVWHECKAQPALVTTPPTDMLGELMRPHLPRGRGSRLLCDVLKRAEELLPPHDINHVRRDLGENPTTGIWLWGNGPAPTLPMFRERFGVSGALASNAFLPRGLARFLRWELLEAGTAPGESDPPLEDVARAAGAALAQFDLVCVHLRAADIAGHAGRASDKVAALERIDAQLVAPLVEALRAQGDWRLLVMPAHATLCQSRRHSAQRTLFLLAGSDIATNRGEAFDEINGQAGEMHLEHAWELMPYFLRR